LAFLGKLPRHALTEFEVVSRALLLDCVVQQEIQPTELLDSLATGSSDQLDYFAGFPIL